MSRLLIGTSTDLSRFISALDSTMATGTNRYIAFGQGASTNNQAELIFTYVVLVVQIIDLVLDYLEVKE
jgi:hypothetical protein